MKLLELPQDILVLILELLTPYDALQLARVCQAAHSVAMPRVLSHVKLRWEYSASRKLRPNAASFAAFILGNPDAYAHHVKSLTLTWITTHDDEHTPGGQSALRKTVMSLVEALRHTSSLRKLAIVNAERLLELSPNMADVIVGYRRLQYIRLQEGNQQALSLLVRTRSCLREVVLHNMRHPFDFDYLRLHAKSLEVFRMTKWMNLVPLDRGPSYGDVWSRVHTLELNVDEIHISIPSLAPAFPNLRFLSLSRSEDFCLSEDHTQTMLEPFAWPSLDVLDICNVWLNLTTPVRVLRVEGEYPDGVPLSSLDHTHLAVLSLDMDREEEWLPNLLTISPSLRSLRYLLLRSRLSASFFSGETRRLQSMDVLQQISQLGLPLHAIALCHVSVFRFQSAPDEVNSSPDTAISVAGLFPTIELVGLGSCRRRTPRFNSLGENPTTWYRVSRASREDDGADDIAVEAVHPDETAGITEYVESLGRSA